MRSRASSSSASSLISSRDLGQSRDSSSHVITNEELGISQSDGALGLTRKEELELGVESVRLHSSLV